MMLFACTSPQHRAVLDSADSLMNARPDSVLTFLNALLPDTTRMSKGDLMRYYLLRTNAENKCDTVLTARHAALMRRVCDYYDRKSPSPFGEGSGVRLSNSRMLAHYLLGRCYSDMGEAPAALQEFHNAADAADTTSTHCDLHTLCVIHSQTAYLFYKSYMPEYCLKELDVAKSLSQSLGDTLTFIRCEEQRIRPFLQMDKPDSVMSVSQRVHSAYIQLGKYDESVRCMATAVFLMAKQEKAKEVKKFLQKYGSAFRRGNKNQSGFYYTLLGKVMISEERYDSALSCFRTQLQSNTNMAHVFGYKGLYETYNKMGLRDSASKYAQLYVDANDSSNYFKYQEILQNAQSLYNYERKERIASIQTAKAKELRLYLLAIIMVAVFLIMLLSILFKVKRERMKRIQTRNNMEYAGLLENYNEAKKDIEILGSLLESNNLLLQRKEQQLSTLQILLAQYQDDDKKPEKWDFDTSILESPILRKIHKQSAKGKHITDEEISDLFEYARNVSSEFMEHLVEAANKSGRKLKEEHLLVCLLIKYRFLPSEIASLLDKSYQSITNMKQRLNRRLFGEKSTLSLEENLRKI